MFISCKWWKIWLKFSFMFMLWSSFFFLHFLLNEQRVCRFSHRFITLIYIIHRILSPFSNSLFAYLTLQYTIPKGSVILTMIVKITIIQQLLLRIAIRAPVWRIKMMTPSPTSLSLSLAAATAHNPKYSTSSITKGSWFSCNLDLKSTILLILFFIFYLNMWSSNKFSIFCDFFVLVWCLSSWCDFVLFSHRLVMVLVYIRLSNQLQLSVYPINVYSWDMALD